MSITELFRLDGKVAVVTGASSGLGVGCAQALAEAGADVVLGARRAANLQATARLVQDASRRALAVPTDVGEPAACEHLVEQAVEEFGRIDILVNNAGTATVVPALHESPEEFRRVVDLNLNATFAMSRAAARHMGPGSSIVNVSSVLALTTAGLPQAAYSASKAGLLGLTRDLAQQWGSRRGIRVNAVCPGFFPSEMTDEYQGDYLRETVQQRTLLARLGRVEELAATVVYLASPASGYVTGATVVVDGGVSIT